MTAIRIVDDHLELASIGSNTHGQIDTHIAAADDYIKRDGSLSLTSDWDIGGTHKILADEISARDAAGLKIYDDGSNGIFIKDGGLVGFGTVWPIYAIDVRMSGSAYLRVRSTTDVGAGVIFQNATGEWNMKINNTSTWMLRDVTNAKDRFVIDTAGRVGIGISTPTAMVDINADRIRLRTSRTIPHSTDSGNTGDLCWDSNYLYICTSTNLWRRANLSLW